MGRKVIKREAQVAPDLAMADVEDFRQHHNPSSADTIPLSNNTDDTSDINPNDGQANLSSDASVQNPEDIGNKTIVAQESLERLGRGVKKLTQVITDLREQGLEELDVPLPKVVVVGDQSTGKSSLIEGMSEIKVPRNAGTCTRCPLEINLTERKEDDPSWKAVVFIRKKYNYLGADSRVRATGATAARPLGPWIEDYDPQLYHFADVFSKEEVTDVLRRAQLAVLNPKHSYEDFRSGAIKESSQVKFSPNVIQLDISGEGLPNLSFYDLPGVINNAEDKDEEYLVPLVKNLVKNYISFESCIVLLAMAMTDDAANSSAAAIVREERAENRTLGVLTKPDRVQDGESHDQWMLILEGRKFKLGYNYHVIKNNPNPSVGHQQAREEEMKFFSCEEPYSTDLACYENNFGTFRLQSQLARLLTEQIKNSLPRITDQISRKITKAQEALRRLPPAPTAGSHTVVVQKLMEFRADLRSQLNGFSQGNEDHFQKQWNGLWKKFRSALAKSRPILILQASLQNSALTNRLSSEMPSSKKGNTPSSHKSKLAETILIDSGDDCESPSEQKEKRRASQTMQSSVKRQRTDKANLSSSDQTNELASGIVVERIFLLDIHDILFKYDTSLPGETDRRVVEELSQISTKHWGQPLAKFLDKIEELCRETVVRCLNRAIAPYEQTQLYAKSKEASLAYLTKLMLKQRDLAQQSLKVELHKPMTYNIEAMKRAKAENLKSLKDDLEKYRKDNELADHEKQLAMKAGKNTPLSERQARERNLASIIDYDKYTQEIVALATARAYYDCAYPRFVDVICQGIQVELFFNCGEQIASELTDQLGLNSDINAESHCKELLEINKQVAEQRRKQEKELDRLLAAQKTLGELHEDDYQED